MKINIFRGVTLWILGLIIIFSSCEKSAEIDLPLEKSRLVVNSIMNPELLMDIKVSRSLSILDNARLEDITNAKIKIFENGILVDELDKEDFDNFTYRSSIYPKENNTYKLEISARKFDPVVVTSKMPESVKISGLYAEFEDSTKPQTSGYYNPYLINIDVWIDDPKGDNFYEIGGYYYQKYKWDSFTTGSNLYLYSDDPTLASDRQGNLIIKDDFFDGQRKKISFQADAYGYKKGSKILITLKSVNEDYYLYFKSFDAYLNAKSDPFAEPVRVYNNVEGGFGILAGVTSQVDSVEVIK